MFFLHVLAAFADLLNHRISSNTWMTSCTIDWHSDAFRSVSYCFNMTLRHCEYALAGSCRIIVWLSIVCRTLFGHVWSQLTIDATCKLCFRAQTDLALDDVDQATWLWIWTVEGLLNSAKRCNNCSVYFMSYDRESLRLQSPGFVPDLPLSSQFSSKDGSLDHRV